MSLTLYYQKELFYLTAFRAELEYLVWEANFLGKKKKNLKEGKKLLFKGINFFLIFLGTTPWLGKRGWLD